MAKCGSILHSPLFSELAAMELVLAAQATCDCSAEGAAERCCKACSGSELSCTVTELTPLNGDKRDEWHSECSSGVSDVEWSEKIGTVSASIVLSW